ncbi:MAG: trigger factor [Lachnospiraceae bacterium]|nr:trigger factor [Lachnospiraceae bacterium]HCJ08485.1 trigger factor [Lachnospiraceae bacterium]
MSLTVENLEKNMAKLTITVPADEFVEAMKASYNKQKGKISVPGFRKGKVPQAYLEKMYGPEMFYEDAANTCMESSYPGALDECGLDVVSRPQIDVTQMEKGKDFIYTATVAVKPEVTLGQYKGVEVDKVEVEVTDEDVQAELLNVQKQNSRTIPVEDRAAKMDDEVTIDFEGFVDGEAFEGGKGENYQLTLGSHSFIDTFEDQIVGKNIGEEFDVNVTFPEDYQAEDLAGKPAVFKCKLNGIKETELPELDDEFASEVSEFDTMDEYKADLKATLQVKKEKAAKNTKEGLVIDQIIENSTMDIPDPMLETTKEQMLNEFSQQLSYQGLSVDQYFQFTGMTREKFLETSTPEAERRIKSRLVLEAIAKAEDIQVSEDELNDELKKMADMYQMDLEQLTGLVGDSEKDAIKQDIAVQKAVDLVTEAAVEK